ncbi:MAG: Fur family transcriptional regulator [Anaerovoracaceae bacterium]|jgi:Fur family peroxide stress response transcriptional regulator
MLNQRRTIQKTLIIAAVKKLEHPTADEVYRSVEKKHPHISKGTVYRNLKAMVDEGRIRKIRLMDGPDNFDHIVYCHYHFICRKCKGIYDVGVPYQEELNIKVASRDGFLVEEHEIVFTGVCPKCNEANDKKE